MFRSAPSLPDPMLRLQQVVVILQIIFTSPTWLVFKWTILNISCRLPLLLYQLWLQTTVGWASPSTHCLEKLISLSRMTFAFSVNRWRNFNHTPKFWTEKRAPKLSKRSESFVKSLQKRPCQRPSERGKVLSKSLEKGQCQSPWQRHDMACENVWSCWYFWQLRTWTHDNQCD